MNDRLSVFILYQSHEKSNYYLSVLACFRFHAKPNSRLRKQIRKQIKYIRNQITIGKTWALFHLSSGPQDVYGYYGEK